MAFQQWKLNPRCQQRIFRLDKSGYSQSCPFRINDFSYVVAIFDRLHFLPKEPPLGVAKCTKNKAHLARQQPPLRLHLEIDRWFQWQVLEHLMPLSPYYDKKSHAPPVAEIWPQSPAMAVFVLLASRSFASDRFFSFRNNPRTGISPLTPHSPLILLPLLWLSPTKLPHQKARATRFPVRATLLQSSRQTESKSKGKDNKSNPSSVQESSNRFFVSREKSNPMAHPPQTGGASISTPLACQQEFP